MTSSSHYERFYPNNPAKNKSFNAIPPELTEHPQYVTWGYGKKRAADKKAKEPISPVTGRKVDHTDPKNWMSFELAVIEAEAHAEMLEGIGYVFSEDDLFTGLDFDNCRDPQTGEVHPAVLKILERLGSPYTEVSPSGTGLKCFVRAKKLPHMDRCKTTETPWDGALEVYDRRHYFAVTGDVYIAGDVPEAQDALEELYSEFFPKKLEPAGSGPLERGRASSPVVLTNDEVVELCSRFYGAEFEDPYHHGDASRWANDYSRADYWLLRKFAWVSGSDRVQMESLYYESALAVHRPDRTDPDKYLRKSYVRDTIEAAIRDTRGFYDPANHQPKETRARDQLRENLAYALFAHPWRDITGDARAAASDYFGYRGVLRMAHKANSLEIDISVRDYQLGAALGNIETAHNSLNRLVDNHGVVVRIKDGSAIGSAARYRIRPRAIPEHTQIAGLTLKDLPLSNPRAYACVPELRGLKKSWLIPHPAPLFEKEYDKRGKKLPHSTDPMRSVGKVAAWVLDIAHAAHQLTGKPVPARYLAERTGMRERDFVSRHARDLVGAGLLEEAEGGFLPPENVEERLEDELTATGALRKRKATRKRIKESREDHWVLRLISYGFTDVEIHTLTGVSYERIAALRKKHDRAPTEEELAASRERTQKNLEVLKLERQGMARDYAQRAVYGDDHDREENQTMTERPTKRAGSPETAPERPSRAPAPEPTEEPSETPCIHTYGPYVFPGGRGCYVCDPDHPFRKKEHQRGLPA